MKTMFIAAALVAAAAHAEARAASTPVQLRILPAGTKVSGTAGKPGSVDLYSFMTLPGDTHSITVRSDSKKPVQVQVFDPGGNVIMQASGVGEVRVEAIASWADAYSVAVIRAEPAAPYSIQREATPGTLPQFVTAHRAGYKNDGGRRRCWIVPGESTRTENETHFIERTIDGAKIVDRFVYKDGNGFSRVRTVGLDGDNIATAEEGKGFTPMISLNPRDLRFDSSYEFSGYLCAQPN